MFCVIDCPKKDTYNIVSSALEAIEIFVTFFLLNSRLTLLAQASTLGAPLLGKMWGKPRKITTLLFTIVGRAQNREATADVLLSHPTDNDVKTTMMTVAAAAAMDLLTNRRDETRLCLMHASMMEQLFRTKKRDDFVQLW